MALDRPLAGSPQAALLSRLARQLTRRCSSASPSRRRPPPSATRSWPGDPSGHIVGVFEKVHRVPFGEYVPFRSFFSHFANLSGVPVDAVPGHGTGLMRTPAGPLGLLVSFEIFYAGRSHESVRAGAELLAVPTNTSSYSTSQVPTPGDRGRHRPGRRDRARPGPGRPDRVQRGGHPAWRRPAAQRARPAPGALRHRGAPPRLHALRPLGRPPGAGARRGWRSSPAGPASSRYS